VVIENAGVSGDTTRMGLDRIDWLLSGEKPDMAILELGANDALRGVPPEETRKNLTAMIEKLKAKDIPTLLAGMKAPRNMGKGYVAKFDPIYPELAKKYDLAFYPFFMEDVIDNPHLLQYDGRHPTYQGVKVIVDKMLPVVEPMVARLEKTPPPPEAN
jgi:acyl-CoA thioesterase-1